LPLGILQEIFIEPTHPTNVEIDIRYPAVGLRCGIQTMHLSSIKSRVIPLTYIPNGNFTGDLNRVHPPISKLTFDTLLWVSGAESHTGTLKKSAKNP
jgi:hypothetical protein